MNHRFGSGLLPGTPLAYGEMAAGQQQQRGEGKQDFGAGGEGLRHKRLPEKVWADYLGLIRKSIMTIGASKNGTKLLRKPVRNAALPSAFDPACRIKATIKPITKAGVENQYANHSSPLSNTSTASQYPHNPKFMVSEMPDTKYGRTLDIFQLNSQASRVGMSRRI